MHKVNSPTSKPPTNRNGHISRRRNSSEKAEREKIIDVYRDIARLRDVGNMRQFMIEYNQMVEILANNPEEMMNMISVLGPGSPSVSNIEHGLTPKKSAKEEVKSAYSLLTPGSFAMDVDETPKRDISFSQFQDRRESITFPSSDERSDGRKIFSEVEQNVKINSRLSQNQSPANNQVRNFHENSSPRTRQSDSSKAFREVRDIRSNAEFREQVPPTPKQERNGNFFMQNSVHSNQNSVLPSPSISAPPSIKEDAPEMNRFPSKLRESYNIPLTNSSSTARETPADRRHETMDFIDNSIAIYYGMKLMLRGPCGHTIFAVKSMVSEDGIDSNRTNNTSGNSNPSGFSLLQARNQEDKKAPSFIGVLSGFGIGSQDEILEFSLTGSNKHKLGPVRYGDFVGIRSRKARGKFLAISSDNELFFSRVHMGDNERWEICPVRYSESGEKFTERRAVYSSDHIILRNVSRNVVLAVDSFQKTDKRIILSERNILKFVTERDKATCVWRVLMADVPDYPIWNKERAYVDHEFLAKKGRFDKHEYEEINIDSDDFVCCEPIKYLDEKKGPEQEQLLIDDLLSALMGFGGQFIKFSISGEDSVPMVLRDIEFSIEIDRMERGLGYLVQRMLPLCTHYVRIAKFINDFSRAEFGVVAHALASSIKLLIKEYLILVTQFEGQMKSGNLSLQRMHFLLQPTISTMNDLNMVCIRTRKLKGGEIINELKNLSISGGNGGSRNLFFFLLEKASAPYLDMLSRWIYTGHLKDDYGEFLICQEDEKVVDNVEADFSANYWDRRYSTRKAMLVVFLRDYSEMILTTGKYLNVVREYGKEVPCHPRMGPIIMGNIDSGDSKFGEIIESAYDFASHTLLNLIMGECDLVGQLTTMKHFFMLDQGDFYVHFMDISEEELGKQVEFTPDQQWDGIGRPSSVSRPNSKSSKHSRVTAVRVESLLHLSIQMSSVSADPYREQIGCEFSAMNLISELESMHNCASGDIEEDSVRSTSVSPTRSIRHPKTGRNDSNDPKKGVNHLILKYNVSWPISLIISEKIIDKYNRMFRYLFFVKHVERKLLQTWRCHQALKELSLGNLMVRTYQLRQRMLHFVQNLVYYITFEVIEPQWHQLLTNIGKSRNADDLMSHHFNYIDTCLKQALLSKRNLIHVLVKLMTVCCLFTNQMKKWCRTDQVTEETVNMAAGEPSILLSRTNSKSSLNSLASDSRVPKESKLVIRRRRIQILSNTVKGEIDTDGFAEIIDRFEENFDFFLSDFMSKLWKDEDAVQRSVYMMNLCSRLDYNGFFRSKYANDEDDLN